MVIFFATEQWKTRSLTLKHIVFHLLEQLEQWQILANTNAYTYINIHVFMFSESLIFMYLLFIYMFVCVYRGQCVSWKSKEIMFYGTCRTLLVFWDEKRWIAPFYNLLVIWLLTFTMFYNSIISLSSIRLGTLFVFHFSERTKIGHAPKM